MIPFTLDKDAERKRALAKIYSLLIKLADEEKNDATPSVINPKEEKDLEPAPLQNNIPPAV
jgi:hypothetical protein